MKQLLEFNRNKNQESNKEIDEIEEIKLIQQKDVSNKETELTISDVNQLQKNQLRRPNIWKKSKVLCFPICINVAYNSNTT